MSRCFPYDPLSGCEERAALIEQIKLQKLEKADEKKQKKRDKKHKKVHRVSNEVVTEDAKHGHSKRKHGERNLMDKKGETYTVAKCDESEQLEKSGLTEEHDLHCAASTQGQDSPDSSRFSKKRKMEAPECNRISHGSLLLRIKLPSLKSKELELPALPVPSEPPCFSGRTETADTQEQRKEVLTQAHDQNGHQHRRCPVKEANVFESFCGGKKSRRRESKYTDLFANWVPQLLQTEDVLADDQDWLFGNQRSGHGSNRCRVESKLPAEPSALSAWPPRACFLPESDIHALPFVVPF